MSKAREVRIIWRDGEPVMWKLDGDEGWYLTHELEVEVTPEGLDITADATPD